MTTADSHIGSNRQHRPSDQVPANTHNTRARRKGARDSGPSAAASTSPPAPGVSGEHLILYGSGLPGLGNRETLPPEQGSISPEQGGNFAICGSNGETTANRLARPKHSGGHHHSFPLTLPLKPTTRRSPA